MTDALPEQAWFAKADEDLKMARLDDEAQFDGRHRTKEPFLASMNALTAGHIDTRIAK